MKLTATLLLAAAASSSAVGISYAPLLTEQTPSAGDYLSVGPISNAFGGGVTAMVTNDDGVGLFGAVPFTFVNGFGVFPGGIETTWTFSQSINRFVLGWAAASTPETFLFGYSVYVGTTYVDAGIVPPILFNNLEAGPIVEGVMDYTSQTAFDKIVFTVNSQNVVGYVVPEPSTYGLVLGGLALVGAVIRRRKISK